MTSTNVNGVCALVDQAKSGCKNDDDDLDKGHHHRKDKDDHKDKDHPDKDHKD